MATASQPSQSTRIDLDLDVHEPRQDETGRRWGLWLLLLAAAAVAAVLALFQPGRSSAPPVDGASMYSVQRGEMILTVTETGNVESAANQDVKCRVAGGGTIIWIVPDGTDVKQGDRLVELDSSTLIDQINTQKINCSKAQSLVIQAKKNHEVAQISVREYLEGTFQQELQTAETNITIAEENLRSAKNSLEYSQRMFQRGYISELELESQQFGVKRAELELAGAQTAKRVLEEFTKVKMLEDLRSQVETTAAALESEKAAFDLEEAKLNRLTQQVENCVIYAPQDGMVVYANERGRRGSQSITIEEGALVRDQQTLFRLPDLTRMQVKVDVHETKVELVKPGMRARTNIQGREFQGEVISVANQHKATSWWSGDVKEYESIVRIDGNVDGLRPGMTAEVEILVAQADDVLSIPVSAIVEQRGGYYCWIRDSQQNAERRELVLGMNNDNFVEVIDGLVEGEGVIRNPRAVVAEANVFSDQVEEIDVTAKFGEAQRGTPNGKTAGLTAAPAAGGSAPSETGRPSPAGRDAARPDWSSLDKDGDGRISKEEAPQQMRQFFDRMDPNQDGFIDKDEMESLRRRASKSGLSGGGKGKPSGDSS